MGMEIRAIKTEVRDKRLREHETEFIRCWTDCLQGEQEEEVLVALIV